ncbi:MAG TPA: glutathione S-transferase N-terminal domain-containing protein [Steroidobacteraceae bacterium]|nr:glutathione S-transferase N-terminal domain-containing protein [Steroidobacteraceae bacterium]
MTAVQIVGRSSSHYTRFPRVFAEELSVPYELVVIHDMTALGPEVYASNPALKQPILRRNGTVLFGAQNICRALAEISTKPLAIVWPEDVRDDLSRNAQELVWHCMSAQVQLVMGTIVSKLPADNVYFTKARAGIENSLRWLDAQLADVLRALPARRDLSTFEASLFCLIEHFVFRQTIPVESYRQLAGFVREFGQRASAKNTTYRLDPPPK